MDIKSCNRLAIGMLIAAKVFGVLGLIMGGMGSRVIGGALLALDGALLVSAFILALGNRRREVTQTNQQKALLEELVREGKLDQYLREIRERRTAAESDSAGAAPGQPCHEG